MAGQDRLVVAGELRIGALSFAVANTSAVAFVVCGILYALFPETVISIARAMFHLDASTFVIRLGWQEFVIGLLSWWFVMAAITGVAVWMYNRAVRASSR